jgi:SAM-dependent methyltransferase
MDYAEYEKMYHLEKTYWWFQGRKHIVLTLLEPLFENGAGQQLIDLGCGTGLLLDELHTRGRPVGVDFSPRALEFCRQRDLDRLIRAEVTHLPLRSASADIVTALDLTEHVEDDEGLIAEVARTLRPGGHLLLTVPAHRFLWSEHDEALWHKRRYSRRTLLALFEGKPLRVKRCTYAITFTFVPIVAYRLFQRLWPVKHEPRTHLIVLPSWLNTVLTGVLRVEAWLLRRVNLPFGVSLIAIAERAPHGGSPAEGGASAG